MYKLTNPILSPDNTVAIPALVINLDTSSYIPMSTNNTDYANFKKEILADEAQLQDAEGDTMSAAAAKEFVATLP